MNFISWYREMGFMGGREEEGWWHSGFSVCGCRDTMDSDFTVHAICTDMLRREMCVAKVYRQEVFCRKFPSSH